MASPLDVLARVQAPETPKNYLVARSIPAGVSRDELDRMTIDDAWHRHDVLAGTALVARNRISSQTPCKTILASPSYLDVKIKLARSLMDPCTLCERRCGTASVAGKPGSCGVTRSHASSWFLHHGEEPPLVPSGTIFFSGCNFRCVFCQNDDISTDSSAGMVVDARKIASIATDLANQGAKNINYVGGDPTLHLAVIVESMRHQNHHVSQLWNSNMFSSLPAVEIITDLIDIWLPDFKYGNDACAERLSGVQNYWKVLTRNLAFIHERMFASEAASMIIRHLVLPNHVECCTVPVLEWIAGNLPRVMVNVMGQYRPHHQVLARPERFKEIHARPTPGEIKRARDLATNLGITWRSVS